MRMLLALTAITLASGPVLAAAPGVDNAVKTFAAVGNDPVKLKTFCEMNKALKALGDKEDAAAEAKITAQIQQLGPDFEAAWNIGDGMDENSPDMKTVGAAMGALSDKCT